MKIVNTILLGLKALAAYFKRQGRKELQDEINTASRETDKRLGEHMATDITRDDTSERMRDGNF